MQKERVREKRKKAEKKQKKSKRTVRKNPAIIPGIAYWLGGSSAGLTIHSDFDIIRIGRVGITKSAIDHLAIYLGISRKNIAEHIFDISVKTFERKTSHAKLDRKISSHALEIAKVMQHGYEVFEDKEKVKLWINRENKSLNNMKPVQLFDTLTGLNMVDTILGRIEEGVYS